MSCFLSRKLDFGPETAGIPNTRLWQAKERHRVDSKRFEFCLGELQIYGWTCEATGIGALVGYKRNTNYIIDRVHANPAMHIVLACQSGSTGIAVRALEKLPPEVKIDTLVMFASAPFAGICQANPEAIRQDLDPALLQSRRSPGVHETRIFARGGCAAALP